jgi:hypothetical protein
MSKWNTLYTFVLLCNLVMYAWNVININPSICSKYTVMLVSLLNKFLALIYVSNGRYRKATYKQTQVNYKRLELSWQEYTYIISNFRLTKFSQSIFIVQRVRESSPHLISTLPLSCHNLQHSLGSVHGNKFKKLTQCFVPPWHTPQNQFLWKSDN